MQKAIEKSSSSTTVTSSEQTETAVVPSLPSINIVNSKGSASSASASSQCDSESVIIDEFEYQYKEELLLPEKEQRVHLLETDTVHQQSSSTESVSTSATPPPSSSAADKDKSNALDTSNDDNNMKIDEDEDEENAAVRPDTFFSIQSAHSRSLSATSSNDGWIDVQKALDDELRASANDHHDADDNDNGKHMPPTSTSHFVDENVNILPRPIVDSVQALYGQANLFFRFYFLLLFFSHLINIKINKFFYIKS